MANIGDKVLVTGPNGLQYMAEVVELHGDIKGLITKVKRAKEDGSYTVEEVSGLVVDAVVVLRKVVLSDVAKAAWSWIRGLFKKG